jgi:putative heme-binding domain-containing protein
VLSLTETKDALSNVLKQKGGNANTRAAAATALATIAPADAASASRVVLDDAGEPIALREKVAEALGVANDNAARATLIAAFRTAPARLQTALATALATTPEGSAALLDAIGKSTAPATLLQQPKLVEKLAAAKLPDFDKTVKQLTRGLPTPQDAVEKLIEQRKTAFAKAKPSPAEGKAVFAKNCAICHQLAGEGKLVGPQLDGVGNRGIDRLVEDVLDPNRNVDPAFRYSNVTLKDTTLITGLQKREEGETLVFVDTTGKEITVPKGQIKSRAESKLSVMPNNFGEIIAPDDVNNLLAFLMQSKAAPVK